jgi:hypothetical protein
VSIGQLSQSERLLTPYHHIDPGFINRRLCFSVFGQPLVQFFNEHRRDGDDHWTRLANDHLLVELVLHACNGSAVPTLGEVLSEEPPRRRLWCSTERLQGNPAVYDGGRLRNRILLPYEFDREVFLEFNASHIVADTGRSEMASENVVSIVAGVHRVTEREVECRPVIMGAPSFDHPANGEVGAHLSWYAWDVFEILPDDIAEFSQLVEVNPSAEEWSAAMAAIPEAHVKLAFSQILGELTRKDWGGEQADHFSAGVRVGSERLTAAFLLKGPATFREMTPEMLGKRADQIYRLASTPAKLLVLQHAHAIGEAVRATLRAFAVSPAHPRRYCLIDGRDTYRILKAYGKLPLEAG